MCRAYRKCYGLLGRVYILKRNKEKQKWTKKRLKNLNIFLIITLVGVLCMYMKEKSIMYMTALQTLQIAVKTFGYKFAEKGTINEYGTEYKIYELVKINKQRRYKK